MYITVASIKKNLGFKGLEINDLIIGIPVLFFFLLLFCFTPYKLASIVFARKKRRNWKDKPEKRLKIMQKEL